MTTKDKYIQKLEELVEILTNLIINEDHEDSIKWSNRTVELESELSFLKADMENEDTDELKDELLKFKKWYDSLSPASKCTVHPPAGSGGSYGIYNLTDADLINIYLSKTK